VERVGRHDNFFELGGHSLLAVPLVRRIGQLAAMEFRLQNIFKLSTPAAIAAWITAISGGNREELLEASDVEGIVTLTKDIERQPVFFVHPVGGTAFCYVELARLLEPQASVYALQSDFAEDDDVLGMPELARHNLQRLRRIQPNGPYRLAGWSFGGLLAWEMAAQLRAQGESVAQLVMIDTHPPQPLPPATSAQRMRRVISYVHEDVLGRDDGVAMDSHDLQGGLEALENLLVRRGLAAEATRRQDTARLVATYDRNLYAMETYSVPSAEQMAVLFIAAEGEHADRLRDAWSRYTHGLLECIALPANHYTIVKGPCIQMIAQRMRQDFGSAPADGPQPLWQAVDQVVS
jgi:thioesterase domain-containing protein